MPDFFESLCDLRATMPNTMHPPIEMFYAMDLVSIRKGIKEVRVQVKNIESNIATHGKDHYMTQLLADTKQELKGLRKAERIAMKGGAK
jgi:hypothetical protein